MLFMVIERFHGADPAAVGERFKRRGRMLPEDVTYHASWVEPTGGRCFQLMEALYPESLHEWTSLWDDLAEFEIVPVLKAAELWERRNRESTI